jgi:hypothetical protein
MGNVADSETDKVTEGVKALEVGTS